MFLAIFSAGAAVAQDTIVLSNGDVLLGEVKGLEQNVLTYETPYSDSDFKIEWDKVKFLSTRTYFLVNTENGMRLNGILRSDHIDSSLVTIGLGPTGFTTELQDVVYMQSVNKSIWSRFDLLLEIGFNVTKANNLRQFNSRTGLGYTAETWSLRADWNTVNSSQDSVEATRRTDASINANWYLQNDWFIVARSTFLRNDEQLLQLRATPSVGIGRYFVRNNFWIFSAATGLAWNIESFQTEEPRRSSLETFLHGSVNLFNTGDFSMRLNALVYPSITESGRFRSDINMDLKYDFFSDFYLKLGTTFNYDSEPAANASQSDYVIQLTVGWDL